MSPSSSVAQGERGMGLRSRSLQIGRCRATRRNSTATKSFVRDQPLRFDVVGSAHPQLLGGKLLSAIDRRCTAGNLQPIPPVRGETSLVAGQRNLAYAWKGFAVEAAWPTILGG